jgi:WS/DGAT/MGAT family acyltransferase
MTLATDVGPAPMHVGAVLVVDAADRGLEPEAVARSVERRVGAVPRLRQVLQPTPFGLGRDVWVDAPGFDAGDHVHVVRCPAPGDEGALLGLAAEVLATPFPADRPRWQATVVHGLADGRLALVPTFHHVVADGVGGLAVLASLVDGATVPDRQPPPAAPPSTAALVRDVARSRAAAVRSLPAAARRTWTALVELLAGGIRLPARCSLNQPGGPRRRLGVVRTDLAAVLAVAHAAGATLNDVVLVAVGDALDALLRRRDEHVTTFVVSVPVSGRRSTDVTELGNQVGVVPVEVPADGPQDQRLAVVSERMRAVRAQPRGASTSVIGPLFGLLARLGIFRWFVEHQRLVHTFVTNVRGPEERLAFLGAEVEQVLPMTATPGNVTVSFAVLSYAGTLALVVVADADACTEDEVALLQEGLDEALARLATTDVSRPAP